MATDRVLVLLLVLPMTAAAQESILLRYHPVRGSQAHVVSETRIEALVNGLPSLPDSTVIGADWRTVVTRRALRVGANGASMSATLDSSRARAKAGDAVRGDVALPGARGLAAQYQLSERLQPTTITLTPGADSGLVAVLLSEFGGFDFPLPQAATIRRATWTAPLRFPLGAYLSATGKVTSSGLATGSGTATLDSLVPRGADTLAYITLQGVIGPATLNVTAEGGTGSGYFSGQVAAALVWSTGWNAVVSAVSKAVVDGRIGIQRPEGQVNGVLSLTITGRHQFRL